MKKSKVDKLVEDLSLKELQEAIERLSSKDEETEEKEEKVQEETVDTNEEEQEKTLPENLVTTDVIEELNKKIEMQNKILQELMKDKPVGVQRKVVSKANPDDGSKYDVNNVFNNLKNLKKK